MGGLFSSDPTPPPPTHRPTESLSHLRNYDIPEYRRTTVASPAPSAPQSYHRFTQPTTSHTRTPFPPRVVPAAPVSPRVSLLPLAPVVYEQEAASAWSLNPVPQGESFQLVDVPQWNEDYSRVKDAFKHTTQKHFKVVKIERVENPFLLGCYLLKKEEMTKHYEYVMESMCFHGTKTVNVGLICENNFNWRLHGDSTGNRFGQGVSFSPISYYASHYSDKKTGIKVMFYAKVLISHIVVGDGNTVLPPKMYRDSNLRFDSSGKEDGHVIVKFSDDEFYPEFVVHYST